MGLDLRNTSGAGRGRQGPTARALFSERPDDRRSAPGTGPSEEPLGAAVKSCGCKTRGLAPARVPFLQEMSVPGEHPGYRFSEFSGASHPGPGDEAPELQRDTRVYCTTRALRRHCAPMQKVFIFQEGFRPFAVDVIRKILESEPGFQDIRCLNVVAASIEATYGDDQDSTIVLLSEDLRRISLSQSTDAALHVAWTLQRHIADHLNIFEYSYSLDLLIKDFVDVDSLRAAIDDAYGG